MTAATRRDTLSHGICWDTHETIRFPHVRAANVTRALTMKSELRDHPADCTSARSGAVGVAMLGRWRYAKALWARSGSGYRQRGMRPYLWTATIHWDRASGRGAAGGFPWRTRCQWAPSYVTLCGGRPISCCVAARVAAACHRRRPVAVARRPLPGSTVRMELLSSRGGAGACVGGCWSSWAGHLHLEVCRDVVVERVTSRTVAVAGAWDCCLWDGTDATVRRVLPLVPHGGGGDGEECDQRE